jgi:hypothetical protein
LPALAAGRLSLDLGAGVDNDLDASYIAAGMPNGKVASVKPPRAPPQ